MARALKDQIDAPASGQGVPPEAAIHILEHARRQNRIASQANPRIAAALIDSVWKRIVGRSPGAGGTVALLGAYGSAVASVIVVPLVAIALIEMGVLPPPSSRLFELVHPDFRTKTQLRQELGESQLWQAAWTDDSRRIEQLVEQGVDINTTSAAFGGMNALMIAAREGSCKALQTLITHRAKLDLRDEKGRTALHFAVEGGLPEAVEVLLEAGANPATHDGEESDLLRLAIRQRNSRTLRVLVNAGADVHGVDDAGQSVIAFAAQHGSARCVKILLQAGADPSVECHKRKDALAYAVARPGHDPDRFAVVRLLWRHVRTHQQDINQTER